MINHLTIFSPASGNSYQSPGLSNTPQLGGGNRLGAQLTDTGYLFHSDPAPKQVSFAWQITAQDWLDTLLSLDKPQPYDLMWSTWDGDLITLDSAHIELLDSRSDSITTRTISLTAKSTQRLETHDIPSIDLGLVLPPQIREVRASSEHTHLDGSRIVDQSRSFYLQYQWSAPYTGYNGALARQLLKTNQQEPVTVQWRESNGSTRSAKGRIRIESESDGIDIQSVRLTLWESLGALSKPTFATTANSAYTSPVRSPRLRVQRYTPGLPLIQTITFSAAFVADSFIRVVIDGITLNDVFWDGSSDATLAGVAARIATSFNVSTAIPQGTAGSQRTIRITAARPGTPFVINSAIVGGSATVSVTTATVQAQTSGTWADVADPMTAQVSESGSPIDRQFSGSGSFTSSTVNGAASQIGQAYRIFAGLGDTVEALFTGSLGDVSLGELDRVAQHNLRDYLQAISRFAIGAFPGLVSCTPTQIAVAGLRSVVDQFPSSYPNGGDVWVTTDTEPAQWWCKLDPITPLTTTTSTRNSYTLDGFYFKQGTNVSLIDFLVSLILMDTHTIRTDELGRLLVVRPPSSTAPTLTLDPSNVVNINSRKSEDEIINDVVVTSSPYVRSDIHVPIGEVQEISLQDQLDPLDYHQEARTIKWASTIDIQNSCKESEVGFGWEGSATSTDRRNGGSSSYTVEAKTIDPSLAYAFPNTQPMLTNVGQQFGPNTDSIVNTWQYNLTGRTSQYIYTYWVINYPYGQIVLNIKYYAVGLPIIQPLKYTAKLANEASRSLYGAKTKSFDLPFLPFSDTFGYLEGGARSILDRFSIPAQYCELEIAGRSNVKPAGFVALNFPNYLYPGGVQGTYPISQINHDISPSGWRTNLSVAVPNIEGTATQYGQPIFSTETTGDGAVPGASGTITITTVNPTAATVGTNIQITGTGFTTAITAVTFNGVSAVPSIASATVLNVLVPPGASSGQLAIVASGRATSAGNFTVKPKIDSFSPTSGGTNTAVVIRGSGFGADAVVKFNGTTASSMFQNSSQITAYLPSGATSGAITVTSGGFTATSAGVFSVGGATVPPAPTITSFTPASGPPGTSVTISGADLGSASVSFPGGVGAEVVSNSATSIVLNVPDDAVTGKITVTTSAGSVQTATNFTVTGTGGGGGGVLP